MNQLGGNSSVIHSTRLKEKIPRYFPELDAYNESRNVLSVAKENVGNSLRRSCQLDDDSEAVYLSRAAHFVREDMLRKKSVPFSGSFTEERIKSCKLLGVHINEHVKWDDHIKHTVSGCFSTLSILRKLKYFAKYELGKQLAETFILSKLDYADLVFYPLPQFLLRRLQRVQFASARFVLGHPVKNFRDVLKIGWLPINKRRDLNLPQAIQLDYWSRPKTALSNIELFNNLPEIIRNCKDDRTF